MSLFNALCSAKKIIFTSIVLEMETDISDADILKPQQIKIIQSAVEKVYFY